MKRTITILIICLTLKAQAQQFCTNLSGFRLEQYRSAVKSQFGNPAKAGKFDDGFTYEAFHLQKNTIVFEYSEKTPDAIWSIQVSGTDPGTNIEFKNLRLGMEKSRVEALIGKPSSTKDVGEYGTEWDYANTNFSFEVNKKGLLSSIKIWDNGHDLFPGPPDLKRVPSFEKIRTVLCSGNNAEILNLLSGDAEVSYNGNIYAFEHPFAAEQATDASKVLALIKSISKDLATVNTNNNDEYEENMRLTLGQDIKHVIKIKKGHEIKEIVLKYFGGQYYIYEINAEDQKK